MNKLIIASFVVLGLTTTQMAAGEDRMNYKKFAKECQSQEQASNDDVKTFFNMSQPLSTQEGKCFAGCFFEALGVLKDGDYSREDCYKWIAKKFPDDLEKQERNMGAMDFCESELAAVPREKCERGPALRNFMSHNDELYFNINEEDSE